MFSSLVEHEMQSKGNAFDVKSRRWYNRVTFVLSLPERIVNENTNISDHYYLSEVLKIRDTSILDCSALPNLLKLTHPDYVLVI